MRAPLPAPYPVPAPTAAPPAAPTAAPVTVPQAVSVVEAMSRPTSVAAVRFDMVSLLLRYRALSLQGELARCRGRGRSHEGTGRRARLPAPGHLHVGPPVGRWTDRRRRLFPQLLIVGLAEHDRAA